MSAPDNFRGQFDEDWEEETAFDFNQELMRLIDSGPQHQEEWKLMQRGSKRESVREVVRAVFREQIAAHQSDSEAVGGALDLGFEKLSRLTEQRQILESMVEALTPQQRDSTVHFNVGEILEHPKYGWTCVALGYDSQCRNDIEWVRQNAHDGDLDRVELMHASPWYELLCDDGLLRYGSQLTHQRRRDKFEFVEQGFPEAQEVANIMLHMLFERFDDETHRYIANADLAKRFPDEVTVS